MLSVVIVIVIVLLSIILAGIGAYVVIHSADEKEEIKPVIDVSGKYAVVVRPARESITNESITKVDYGLLLREYFAALRISFGIILSL